MPVYVDPIMTHGGSATFPWKDSCHMWADTDEELFLHAAKIGLKPQWVQRPKTRPNATRPFTHFDLTTSKRALAVAKGAISLTGREAVILWRKMGILAERQADAILADDPPAKTPLQVQSRKLPPKTRPAAFLDFRCLKCNRRFGATSNQDVINCPACGHPVDMAALNKFFNKLRKKHLA